MNGVPLPLSSGLQCALHMIRCGSDSEYYPFHLPVHIPLSLDPHNVGIGYVLPNSSASNVQRTFSSVGS